MKQIRAICLALFAVTAVFALTAASASAALPSILFLPGEGPPAELKGESSTANTEVATVAGSTLGGKGWLIQIYITANDQRLGKASVLLRLIKEPKSGKECSTAGDSLGLVLIDNAEWHLVLFGGRLGILLLIPAFTVTCGTLKIKLEGSTLAPVTPFGKEVLTTESFEGSQLCKLTGGKSNGKPEFSEYLNEAEKTVKAEFKSNFGLENEESCVQIEGTIKLKPTKMIEIMEP